MDTLNGLLSAFGAYILQTLPRSPFADFFDNYVAPDYISWLCWFFPVHDFLVIFGLWLTGVSIYIGLSIILRWVKIIS